MRGKLEVKEFKSTATRIIPAHAGQTSTLGMTVVRPSDHPRACGANLFDSSSSTHAVGSSPRMRGKPAVIYPRLGARRIIPAHAGQTEKSHQKQWFAPDHPRACGANAWSPVYGRQDAGSSPRMRGKLHQVQRATHADRIIPAHAGQTSSIPRLRPMRSDHPRACGANKGAFAQTLSADGSSPRMRGKHLGADRFNQRGRIIPAHAEQTFPQLFCPVFCSDHPRACGANHGGRAAFHAIHGSSPRMRGKLGQIIKTETRNRIIPAHAGQTHGGVIVAVPSTDHPRACGANPNTVIPVTATAGSSPRMRGKPHLML